MVWGVWLSVEYGGLNNYNRVLRAYYAITIIRSPRNKIGNYSGPCYSRLLDLGSWYGVFFGFGSFTARNAGFSLDIRARIP